MYYWVLLGKLLLGMHLPLIQVPTMVRCASGRQKKPMEYLLFIFIYYYLLTDVDYRIVTPYNIQHPTLPPISHHPSIIHHQSSGLFVYQKYSVRARVSSPPLRALK